MSSESVVSTTEPAPAVTLSVPGSKVGGEQQNVDRSDSVDEGTLSVFQSNSPEELGTAVSSPQDSDEGVAAIDNSSATSLSYELNMLQDKSVDDKTMPVVTNK